MKSKGTVDAVEHTLVDHVLGTVVALFAWLEHEPDLAGEFRLVFGQKAGGAEQHGDMSVVAAGMHHLLILRTPGDVQVFLQWQCIHVAAQQNGWARLACVQVSDDGCQCLAGGDVQSKPVECFQNFFLGLRQIEPKLRVGMNRPAEFDRVVLHALGGLDEFGSNVS